MCPSLCYTESTRNTRRFFFSRVSLLFALFFFQFIESNSKTSANQLCPKSFVMKWNSGISRKLSDQTISTAWIPCKVHRTSIESLALSLTHSLSPNLAFSLIFGWKAAKFSSTFFRDPCMRGRVICFTVAFQVFLLASHDTYFVYLTKMNLSTA